MMNNKLPSRDALFHNRTESMNLEELCKFEIMLKINHIINCALASGGRERSSGKCLTMQYTSFLENISQSFEATVCQEEKCSSIVVFDDFIRIAEYSFSAIKDIIANPSTHITKVDTKVLANRASGFGSKTMRWMSQRPGRTIQEKISPENKILTTKTVFSTDTKENREFMYLYKILYEAIVERFKGTSCQNCNSQSNCGYYDWISKMRKLLAYNNKIKTGDFEYVKPIKQSVQNNKLMCDKNYKIVWDAVQMLSHVEGKIYEDFNSNLHNRLSTLLFWLILGKLNSFDNVIIEDFAGSLQDKNGKLWFGSEAKEIDEVYNNDVLVLDNYGRIRSVLSLSLNRGIIKLSDGKDILFKNDISDFFFAVNEIVERSYIEAFQKSLAEDEKDY